MKKFKLRDLEVDRVDLVDRGANPDADIVIVKNRDLRAEVVKNMKEGYPPDTQLKNGPAHPGEFKQMPKKKSKKKDEKKKGTAFPERMAAEVSDGYPAPMAKMEKHSPGGQSHDQQRHGKGGAPTVSGKKKGKRGRMKLSDLVSRPNLEEKYGSRTKYEQEHWKGVRDANKKRKPKINDDYDDGKAMYGSPVAKHTPGGKDHDQSSHGRKGGGGGRRKGSSGGAPTGPRMDAALRMLAEANRDYRARGSRMHPPRMSPPDDGGGKKSRPLYQIATEIERDWSSKGKGVNYAARPYLDAMKQLSSIDQAYGFDSGKSVVLYFLSNARSWRGETAKRVKAELKEMAGIKKRFDGPPEKPGVGQAAPGAESPPMGKPAAKPTAPPSGEGLSLSPNGPGPALGPGTPPGKRPIETPKKKKSVPPKMKAAPAPTPDDKKKKLTDLLRSRTPSAPPGAKGLEQQ